AAASKEAETVSREINADHDRKKTAEDVPPRPIEYAEDLLDGFVRKHQVGGPFHNCHPAEGGDDSRGQRRPLVVQHHEEKPCQELDQRKHGSSEAFLDEGAENGQKITPSNQDRRPDDDEIDSEDLGQ